MAVVRKFNYVRFITFIVIVLAIIIGIVFGIKSIVQQANYKKTYEYKLLSMEYTEEEAKFLEEKLNDKQLEQILKYDKNSNIVELMKQKYFIFGYLDKYLYYMKNNKKETDYYKIVAIINTDANVEWLDEERETNVDDGDLMLVNRLYGLSSDYEPEDLVNIPVKYAFDGKKIKKSILDQITGLMDEASENGYKLIVTDGYRSYSDQENIYDSYADLNGRGEADKIVARPGHSEYQTGLSFDLEPYAKTYDEPLLSEEYIWLKNNAYKYGFIFRFESDKEYLTGFRPSTWRLRYVGEKAAKIIHDENICFEEYYGFYIRGDGNKNE